ncbi:MAG: MFS transporter [Anaerolineales bacterium]|nr:MFS transporter [Anaerolineales bacterium]
MESKAQQTALQSRGGAFAALQHRNFQLYFGGQLISNAGTWMQVIAQGWLVYQISHSELALGVVGFASAIPTLLVSPWGGVIVDRVPKRTVLVLTQASAMLLAFILAALTFTNVVQEWHIILLAAGIGVVNSFDGPARQAFVVEMVGREDLPNAIAVNSMMINIARVIGPALGGFLLALLGASWCFTINGFSYLAVIAGLLAMDLKPHEAPAHSASPFKELSGGLKYVAQQPELKGLLLLSLIFSVFGISYSTILPAFVERVLNQGAVIYGWINAMIGVGAVWGAFMIANHYGERWRGSWLLASSIGFPIILTLFAFTHYVPLSLLFSVGLGMGFMVQFTMINTLLQTRVEDRLRGRVMGLYTLTFFGFSPFGNLIVGLISESIGLSVSVALFAALSLLLSLIVFRKIPQIQRLP